VQVVTAAGQEQRPPDDFHDELARWQAQTLAKMRYAQTMMTANQALFDVKYYGLDLKLDVPNRIIQGAVEVVAEVIGAPIREMQLNLLNNMQVSQVTVAASGALFTHDNDLLTVHLDRDYHPGEKISAVVVYRGTPESSGFGAFAFDSYNRQPMIWSLSEPFGARNWWPCKDLPSDKADSVDIRVTVPSGLIVGSNGTLRQVTDNGVTKTYWWHEGYPITTYLVSVAIHPYRTFSHYYRYAATDSMEVKYFVFPDHYDLVQTNYGKTVNMIRIYSDLFGQYPFVKEKYGHAEFVWGGGMEHQTLTSLGGWGEYLIAHELAHQWWGDMITCRDFHHIWLNEGFATYSEALYAEAAYGPQRYRDRINSYQYFGPGTIYVPDLSDVSRIFNGNLSYRKAAWVLHMLRHVVGDSTFFAILKAYYADSRFQYGTATTEDFRDLCEAVSGMELDQFFDQWIYREYFPHYSVQWNWTPSGSRYDVTLRIEQKQTNTVVFKMPLDITVVTATGEKTFVVQDSLRSQAFLLTVDSPPMRVLFDPDNWILKQVEVTPVSSNVTDERPRRFSLSQNYPNPFNAMTAIAYDLPESVRVRLEIYDLLGHRVRILADRFQSPGRYRLSWDGRDELGNNVPTGVYVYRLTAGAWVASRKLIVLR